MNKTHQTEPLDLETLRKFFNALPQSNSDRYGLALIAEVERLREDRSKLIEIGSAHVSDKIDLEGEVATLRDALEPFAKLAAFWLERDEIHGLNDEDTCATEIEFSHLRAAHAAMEKTDD